VLAAAGFGVLALSIAIPACVAAPPCAAILFSAGATAGDAIIITSATALFSGFLNLLAADPIDLNYMTVALPIPSTPPSLSSSAPPYLTDLVNSETDGDSLATAMMTAFNRAEGTFFSNAPTFEQLQLDAFNTYEQQLAADLRNIGEDYNQLVSTFDGQFSNILGNGDQLISDANALTGSTSVGEPSSICVVMAGIVFLCMIGMYRRDASHKFLILSSIMEIRSRRPSILAVVIAFMPVEIKIIGIANKIAS
jgi:hypothetical protein